MGRTSVSIDFDDGARTFDFEDVALPKSAWENVKAYASPEHLFLFGIGTKLRLFVLKHKMLYALIPLIVVIVVGALLAVFVDVSVGVPIAVIAYLIAGIFYAKVYKMGESVKGIQKLLKKTEYYDKLDKLLKPKWYVTLFYEFFAMFAIPCVLLDFIAEMLEKPFPHFADRRAGVTFAIPLGCGVDDVAAMSEYYRKTLGEKLGEAVEDFTGYLEDKEREYMAENTYKLSDGTVLRPTSVSNYDSENGYEYRDESGNIWYSQDNESFVRK